jgi:hypothetical protein
MTDAEIGRHLDGRRGTIHCAEPEARVLKQSPTGGVDPSQKMITG